MHILAAVAETERNMAFDPIRAGMASKKARGAYIGRSPALSRDHIDLAKKFHADGQSYAQIPRIARGRNGKYPAVSTVHLVLCAA
jgi:DNA invertase Pin-like site-specific DNA recombinase